MSGGDHKGQIFGGTVSAVAGILLVLIGFFDPRDDAFPAGRGAVFGAAGAFFMAGVALLYAGIAGERANQRVQTMIGVMLLGSFAAVPGLIFLQGKIRPPRTPAPVFEDVSVRLERDVFEPEEIVAIRFSRPIVMPEGYHFFVSIVPAKAELYQHGSNFSYLKQGDESALLRAPRHPGFYEVRLYRHMSAIASFQPFRVGPPPKLEAEPG